MKSLRIIILGLFFTGLVPQLSSAQVTETRLSSPDKKVTMTVRLQQGQLVYGIYYKGKPVIETSALSIVVGGKAVGKGTSLSATPPKETNESYRWRGNHSLAKNHFTSSEINVVDGGQGALRIQAKVFNDGVAFRYIIDGSGNNLVEREDTEFTIPAGSLVWSQKDIKAYEGKYQEQKIEEITDGQLAGPPLTIKLPGKLGFAAISEGGLVNYAGMSLRAMGGRKFKANLTGKVNKTGPVESAWRIVEIGPDLNTLVNSDIVHNVSPTMDASLFPDGFSTSWIKPGRSVWSWLAGNGGVSFENMKKYSKWAGELGFEYNLVDEGWSKWKDGDKDCWALLKELVDYSKQQNVKVWVWKAYPNRDGIPGLKKAEDRIDFFKKCAEAGVVGLKLDFFDTESQEVVDFYQAALKDAAELHLMLDFHGANKPTGETRTWPNEMTREGVRGLENGTSWPKHNTTLPFTRYLAGHGDYTPLSFRTIANGTTITHQVATVAVFTSPFMCLGVNPEALVNHKESKLPQMVKSIPVTWDETIVLPQSEIGELALFAKRKGDDWYLVALNGETKRKVEVNLSFLDRNKYEQVAGMSDIEDMPTAANYAGTNSRLKNKISFTMEPGGGYIALFKKK